MTKALNEMEGVLNILTSNEAPKLVFRIEARYGSFNVPCSEEELYAFCQEINSECGFKDVDSNGILPIRMQYDSASETLKIYDCPTRKTLIVISLTPENVRDIKKVGKPREEGAWCLLC